MISVTKRNGTKEPLDIEKIHRVVAWACEGLSGVSASEIELKTQIQFYYGIKSDVIQETLIKAAADLISEDSPNYQYVAGRLINYHLRKQVYGQYEPIAFWSHLMSGIDSGVYTIDLLNSYSSDEIVDLGKYIEHERDFDITFAGMEQMRGNYL